MRFDVDYTLGPGCAIANKFSSFEAEMTVVVRFTARGEARALPILLRHSPGMILANRTYVLHAEAVEALRTAGVRFTEVSRESSLPTAEGAIAGERI